MSDEKSGKKVRLGFVGVGGMGQAAHLQNYLPQSECEVVAVSDLRFSLAKDVATRYRIANAYPSHKEMLAAGGLDALVAIQFFGVHGQIVPELLKFDLPVITEKPIARAVAAGQRILDAARGSKGRLCIAYHKRSDPATMAGKAVIDEWKSTGRLGAMRYVRVTMPPGDWVANGFRWNVGTSDPYPALANDEAEFPEDGGQDGRGFDWSRSYDAFVNYYIHQVNLIRHLLGEDYEATYADAGGVQLCGRSKSGVSVLLEMAPYNTSDNWDETALVCFERGYVRIDLPAPLASNRPGRLTVFEDPQPGHAARTWSPTLPWVGAMWQQAINYVQAVQGKATPLCGPEDAVKDLQVARQYVDLKNAQQR